MKKLLAIFLTSAIFLLFGTGIVQAARLCEPCVTNADCDPGLECIKGKCRGCPVTPGVIRICNPIQACEFEELIGNIIDFIFYIAMALAPLMVLIGAFYIMSAGGNPKRVETGKNIILYTVIGLVIVFLAKAIAFMIRQVLTG